MLDIANCVLKKNKKEAYIYEDVFPYCEIRLIHHRFFNFFAFKHFEIRKVKVITNFH